MTTRHWNPRRSLTLGLALPALALALSCKPPEPVTPPVENTDAPRITQFSVSPEVVEVGQKVTLTWATENATTVEIRDAHKGVLSGIEPDQKSGSVEVPITEETLFVLTATNDLGVRDSAAAAVRVHSAEGKVIFVAAPTMISAGHAATLAWSAAGADDVSLKDKAGTPIDLKGQTSSGAVTVSPLASTEYILTVEGRPYSAMVEVRPTIGAFTSDAEGVLPGETVTLHWQTVGALQVTVVRAGFGPVHEETDPSKVADGTFEETVPESIAPGSVFTYELVAQGATAGAQSRASKVVYVAGTPVIKEARFPLYAREGGTFEVSWETLDTEQVEIVQDGIVIFRTLSVAAATKGSVTLHTPAAPTPYVLRALDLRGGVALSDEAIVDPVGMPSLVKFEASPQPGIANGGDPVTLSWEIDNARNVTITAINQYQVHEVHGTSAELGQVDAYPNKYTEYEINADNGIGDKITPVVVTATVTTPARLIYSPTTAPAGAIVTVTGSTVPNGGDLIGMPVVEKNRAGDAFVDISGTGTQIMGCCYNVYAYSYALPQTFTTKVFGTPVSSNAVIVSPNGWFKFSSIANYTYDENPPGGFVLPTTYLEPLVIMPFWHNWYVYTTGQVYYRIDGTGASQRLIVQWNKVKQASYNSPIEVTFQAQVFADGRIVFAYKTVSNATVTPAIGIVNGNESGALTATSMPADGDTFSFFHQVSIPTTFTATPAPFTVRQLIGTGPAFIELEEQYPVMPPGQFSIVEVNANPAVSDGQWIEVQNNTTSQIDLGGWDIDFGGGNKHTISGSLILPASGTLLLAQSPGANDGLTVDYEWGTSMGMGADGVSLSISGGLYATLKPSAGASLKPGYSWQRAPLATGPLYLSGTTALDCAAHSTSTYGTNGQFGTPGAANTTCPAFNTQTSITAAFESISVTGTKIPFTGCDGDTEPITLADPFVIGRMKYTTLWAGINGWISMNPQNCSTYPCGDSNLTAPSTSLPTGLINPGLIALYWDDLNVCPGGAYYLRRDPDATPGTGDEYTIVSWESVTRWGASSDNLNFQVKFFDSGNLEYHFGTMTGGTGSSATTWFEDPSGRAAYRIGANSSYLTSNVAWRFSPK